MPGDGAGPATGAETGSAAGGAPGGEWRNLGETSVVATPWFELALADVELPGGRRLDHYLLRVPPGTAVAMLDDRERVLLLWRHRFIPGSWGWELPAGIVDPAEDIAAGAVRQALKESGWEAGNPRPLLQLEPYAGLADSVQHIFWTDQASYRGAPEAAFEAERVEWIPIRDAPALIAAGQIRSAVTAATLLLLASSGRPTA